MALTNRIRDHNRDRDDRVILAGASNYGTWKTDVLMDLEAENVDYVLDPDYDKPYDPRKISDSAERAEKIGDYLAEFEEIPENGWGKKIGANSRKWMKEMSERFDNYKKDNSTAKRIIYRSCASYIQGTIQNAVNAIDTWQILTQSYGSAGFEGIYTQTKLLRHLTYDKGIESYTNKFTSARQLLEREGAKIDEQILIALYLEGLGDKFKMVTRDLIMSTEVKSFDDVYARVYAEERNFIEKTLKPTKKDNQDFEQDSISGRDEKRKKTLYCEIHGHQKTHSTKECLVLRDKSKPSTPSIRSSTPATPTTNKPTELDSLGEPQTNLAWDTREVNDPLGLRGVIQ